MITTTERIAEYSSKQGRVSTEEYPSEYGWVSTESQGEHGVPMGEHGVPMGEHGVAG